MQTLWSLVPLQNRVTPFGDLVAMPGRGLMMGNRGVLHDAGRRIVRPWQLRRWIACVTEFRGRYRKVMQPRRYTELFFLDEPTALAAGHRPCFECRRQDALAFSEAWQVAKHLRTRPTAGEMDIALHRERLDGRAKRLHRRDIDALPDGAFVALEEGAFAVRGDSLLRWTPDGYDARQARRRGITVDLLTPPAILTVLSAGYRPCWHPSAQETGGRPAIA